MLAKLEECSLLNKKDNLGNAALKQGKKFNKYSGIVKSKISRLEFNEVSTAAFILSK